MMHDMVVNPKPKILPQPEEKLETVISGPNSVDIVPEGPTQDDIPF